MNLETVEKIARAVLYEGYMLYPYRPSAVKNRQRWNFGVLYPPAHRESQGGADAYSMRTECLVEGSRRTMLEVKVKFLQTVERTVGRTATSMHELPPREIRGFHPVESLEVEGRIFRPWQEAVEREVSLPPCSFETLSNEPRHSSFAFAAEKRWEAICNASGAISGGILRRQELTCGEIAVTVEDLGGHVFKVAVNIRNTAPSDGSGSTNRNEALLCSLVSTHTILRAQDGEFVSLVDPPDKFRELTSDCNNIGTWPVLAGDEARHDTMLSSPIILYDYPQIAPESSGDLFDSTEIDEILSLRIMTMTDEEKREMRESDEHARRILERTETLPVEQLVKLHGVLRGLRPIKEGP